MNKKSVESLAVKNKKVLVRVDFNVPIKEGVIQDSTRIQEALPTIKYLLDQGAAVILCSHMGRPKGTVNMKYTIEPVAKKLGELLGLNVLFAKDCIGSATQSAAKNLKSGEILLLENLRFHPEEEKNDTAFAKELAALADFFVQDAFGSVHRAHASTSAVAQFLPSAAGFLLKKELAALGSILDNPQHPFVAVLGGAKVSDKLGVIENLLKKADTVVVGGAMAYTFLKSQGIKTGKSLVEDDKLELTRSLLASSNKSKIVLPKDHRIAQKIEAGTPVQTTPDQNIADDWIGVDIGTQSEKAIDELMKKAKTILWNGPMGIFEIKEFSQGTFACAKSIATATKNGAYSIVGGGDSVSALNKSGLAGQISHISTGGGASLEFLEGLPLPGVEVLPNA